jgi:hypothetical protein
MEDLIKNTFTQHTKKLIIYKKETKHRDRLHYCAYLDKQKRHFCYCYFKYNILIDKNEKKKQVGSDHKQKN